MFPQIFWEQTIYNRLKEGLRKHDCKNERNQTWHAKVDDVFVIFWLSNSEARLSSKLEQHGLPPRFFRFKIGQHLNENRLYTMHWRYGV